MKQWMKKTFAWVVALVMMLGCAMAAAEQTADLEALYPLMDLVCAAALDAQSEDDYAIVVPDSEGELTPEFVQAFIRIGQSRGESVGVTAAMMTDTAAQKTLLSSIFDAQLPELTAVAAADSESNYIGFRGWPGSRRNRPRRPARTPSIRPRYAASFPPTTASPWAGLPERRCGQMAGPSKGNPGGSSAAGRRENVLLA